VASQRAAYSGREALRLCHDVGFSYAHIARVCGLSKGVVSKYLSLADAKGVGLRLAISAAGAETFFSANFPAEIDSQRGPNA
jgi:predicted transcriptional regulator